MGLKRGEGEGGEDTLVKPPHLRRKRLCNVGDGVSRAHEVRGPCLSDTSRHTPLSGCETAFSGPYKPFGHTPG